MNAGLDTCILAGARGRSWLESRSAPAARRQIASRTARSSEDRRVCVLIAVPRGLLQPLQRPRVGGRPAIVPHVWMPASIFEVDELDQARELAGVTSGARDQLDVAEVRGLGARVGRSAQ